MQRWSGVHSLPLSEVMAQNQGVQTDQSKLHQHLLEPIPVRNLQNQFALHLHERRPQISVNRLPLDALGLPGGGERDPGEQALAHGPYSAP